MYDLYAFLTGPGVWIALTVFCVGLALRVVHLYGLSQERDRVFYNHVNLQWALRSIGHWLMPWGSTSLRRQPVFALAIFVFHVLLFAVPIFLVGHNMLWREAFGWNLWTIPDGVADVLTTVFLGAALFLLLRRIIRPEVRIMTSAWDFSLLLLTALPFLTGFLAYHQFGPYETMLVLHVLSGEILLIVVPMSKLAHVVLFFFSRAFVGFEMGERRGTPSW